MQLIKKSLPFGNITVKAKLADGTILGIHVTPYGIHHITGHFVNGKSLQNNCRKQKIIAKYMEYWKTMLEYSRSSTL